jgi:hypothetical protein
MAVQQSVALLLTAFLFGGMTLFSFAFAAFLFTHLPMNQAGALLRAAFPHFYLGVIVIGAAAAASYIRLDTYSAVCLAVVALSTVPVRQWLMPAINAATDAAKRKRFNILHSVSVAIGVLQIAAVGYVLLRVVS